MSALTTVAPQVDDDGATTVDETRGTVSLGDEMRRWAFRLMAAPASPLHDRIAAKLIERERRRQCDTCGGTGIAERLVTERDELVTRYCACDAGRDLLVEDRAAAEEIRRARDAQFTRAINRHLVWGKRPEREAWTLASHPLANDPTLTAHRDVYDAVVAWRSAWDGTSNLILTGNVGSGKTGVVIGMLRDLRTAAVARRELLAFRVVSELFPFLQQGYHDEQYGFDARYAELKNAWVLAIDDIGTAKRTEWNEQILFDLINERCMNERPTWLTSNLGMEAISAWMGPRVLSRLLENGDVFAFDGPDLRDPDVWTPRALSSAATERGTQHVLGA